MEVEQRSYINLLEQCITDVTQGGNDVRNGCDDVKTNEPNNNGVYNHIKELNHNVIDDSKNTIIYKKTMTNGHS